MRALAVLALLAVVVALVVDAERRRWNDRASRLIDAQIARKRYRYRPGMERMDEALRDRAARRRRERAEALENVRRELDNPRKLHRVG